MRTRRWKIDRDIEERWLRDVSCNMADTDEGPVRQMPSEYALYARIYSPKVMRAWQLMLAEAKSLVAGGSPEARRIELFRREFYMPLARRVADYARSTSVETEVARRKTSLRPNLLANGDFSAPPSGGSKTMRRGCAECSSRESATAYRISSGLTEWSPADGAAARG